MRKTYSRVLLASIPFLIILVLISITNGDISNNTSSIYNNTYNNTSSVDDNNSNRVPDTYNVSAMNGTINKTIIFKKKGNQYTNDTNIQKSKVTIKIYRKPKKLPGFEAITIIPIIMIIYLPKIERKDRKKRYKEKIKNFP